MVRRRSVITGIVQGVGFRPFVYALAQRYALQGWVQNTAQGVVLEVQGDTEQVERFFAALPRELPPLAMIDTLTVQDVPVAAEADFSILASDRGADKRVLVSPDMAICADCLRELQEPADRRYRYPFINCTNCGPRYSIIRDVPYDRQQTTMAAFAMCPACQAEYDDPGNRRFHAQPNACPVCGPRCKLTDSQGEVLCVGDESLVAVRTAVQQGKIVAIKGIGGYHLACDARQPAAVMALRQRKVREDKPFAVMAGSLASLRRQCNVSSLEEQLLCSSQRPIVLLEKGIDYDLAAEVAPDNPWLGAFLPYTPLHQLLLQAEDLWVMTSANRSDEPIAYTEAAAYEQLAEIADLFLVHDRPIERRVDDSVLRIIQGAPGFLRRSRGYAPVPLRVGRALPPLLAVGAELKNTYCLTRGRQAFLSAHVGDLENQPTYQSFSEGIERDQRLFAVEPLVIAHDLHPDYLSTQYALQQDLPRIGVQHHHAHIAGVMLEHGLNGPVLGIALDGTGYGTDGSLWGGEFLVVRYTDFERWGHLRQLPLPGGSKAIREPWRLQAWFLRQQYGAEIPPCFSDALPVGWELAVAAAEKGLNAPRSSGAGRWFDLAAMLLGGKSRIHYEGQAAVELELAAWGGGPGQLLPYRIEEGLPRVLDFTPLAAALAEERQRGAAIAPLAAAAHRTMGAGIIEMIRRMQRETGIRQVALSGGVWQNQLLLTQVVAGLEAAGLEVYQHREIPANDGGICLGQAAVAAAVYGR